MQKFHVTYEIVTPESAEHGDAAERGFVLPGGWHEELPAHVFGEEAGKIKDECGLSLREAVDLVSLVEDSGHCFTEIDERQNYNTGESEIRSLHPPENITPASYGRLRRLLKVR